MRITISGRGLKHSKEIPPKHHDMKKGNEYISYLYPRIKIISDGKHGKQKEQSKKIETFSKTDPERNIPQTIVPTSSWFGNPFILVFSGT